MATFMSRLSRVAPALATLLLLSASGAPVQAQTPNVLSAAESKAGWKLLFDGTSTAGWRGFKQPSVPAAWQAMDGTLTRVADGPDLITEQQYGDFELKLEWKISEGGNSGIIYRLTEAHDETYETGAEMQVLDDSRPPDGKSPLTTAGADYGLYPAPRGVVKPVGEWNAVRIVVKGNHVEHWLNGKRVVTYELGSADWKARVAASKFKAWPDYGLAKTGYIALQNHGGAVSYRSIRIRPL